MQLKKILIGICASLAAILIAGGIIAHQLVTRSFTATSGSQVLNGLEKEVKVYRDNYGVPHIIAQNEHDAFYTVGYTHAQDRLWQMELMRRVGMGRLSEILGGPALKTDMLFRTLGLWQHAQKLSRSVDGRTRDALDAYAEGINSFIASHPGKYPIEFDMLNLKPEPWRPEHSLLISRLMGWELNYARWVDMLLLELVQRFGEERASEIFPYWDKRAPLIIPGGLNVKHTVGDIRPLFEAEREYRSLLGIRAFESGSNAWVISARKSRTGSPILANDPHLLLMSPARWYELHISAPTIDVAGMSIPGVPFVIAGRNRRIAWGVTNAMMDDEDFYVETVDSLQHPTKYKYNEAWRPIEEIIDTIIVRNALPVVLSIYRTHRGPIINRIEPSAESLTSLVSMRWVGHEISDETSTFYRINKASNWKEFEDALRSYGAPAQNFVYADVDGNIGYRTGGKLPVRAVKGPTLPFPGWTGEFEWKGFVPFDEMPHMINPPEGFIATANNKIIDDSFPYHISGHWESPWRSIRINEVLREQDKFSMEDIQALQMDLISTQAREIVPYIIRAYDSVQVEDPDVKKMLKYYQNWNYEMDREDVSTTLFQTTVTKMIYNIFHDRMGDRLYGLYDTLASIPLSALSHLLTQPESEWFDDVNTPAREYRDDMIRKSVNDALIFLREELGGELKEWRWERLHTVTFRHIFGAKSYLSVFFNVGPFPVGGSHSTVNVAQYFIAHPYEAAVGPSMRQIFNMADLNDTRSILPPGQSGQVFSDHYKDQIMYWLNGGYKSRPMQLSLVESKCTEVLRLEPAK